MRIFFMFPSVLLVFLFVVNTTALRDSNTKFKLCCSKHKNADRICKQKFCDFSSLAADNVLFFLNSCTPKGNTVPDMWACATSKADHTECCKKKGVLSQCLPYCNYKTTPNDYLKHIFCLQNFNPIKDCFRSHLNDHPNIFGDE
ncbi:unnamed protein product [Bursaphelenchus xylophilus]|uniref:(pine wood nematode) hypothetical protein n=1 Tax=Bursaphelenchus xylophilus TaxID=6326 RepID=A0A1I7SWT3_BURXY|nr:unnamed protein product [Bursaphelenchus xylophilus]CAG9099895.1 unnamed protein product [Bursaphelenchus xylophilus]